MSVILLPLLVSAWLQAKVRVWGIGLWPRLNAGSFLTALLGQHMWLAALYLPIAEQLPFYLYMLHLWSDFFFGRQEWLWTIENFAPAKDFVVRRQGCLLYLLQAEQIIWKLRFIFSLKKNACFQPRAALKSTQPLVNFLCYQIFLFDIYSKFSSSFCSQFLVSVNTVLPC